MHGGQTNKACSIRAMPETEIPPAIGTGSKGQKKADMDFIPYRLFSIVPPFSVVSKCALAGGLFKPPSEREVARGRGSPKRMK